MSRSANKAMKNELHNHEKKDDKKHHRIKVYELNL